VRACRNLVFEGGVKEWVEEVKLCKNALKVTCDNLKKMQGIVRRGGVKFMEIV